MSAIDEYHKLLRKLSSTPNNKYDLILKEWDNYKPKIKRKKYNSIDNKYLSEIKEMQNKGISIIQIAYFFNTSRQNIYNILKRGK